MFSILYLKFSLSLSGDIVETMISVNQNTSFDYVGHEDGVLREDVENNELQRESTAYMCPRVFRRKLSQTIACLLNMMNGALERIVQNDEWDYTPG